MAAELADDDEDWLPHARRAPSPNCDERPRGEPLSLLVLHSISLPPHRFDGDFVVDFFLNRLEAAAHPFFATIAHARVSSHLFIRRDGSLIQFVPLRLRAWHAGVSQWRGRSRCNDFSIGIELEGSDLMPFRDAQYDRLATVSAHLLARFPIVDVVGHSDIAPMRKTDPGPFFDWQRYRSSIAR
jgi:AmpD protein